ncbi:MAG TPA: hypothetical protein VN541_09260 [Tepidisphaeraceae bacterium]|nr:hypothetical protein [Tepidisphaeraceae bacterium]
MRLVAFAFAWMICASAASAQVWSFSFSGGYSNVQFEHREGLFYAHSGGYVDADFAWRVPNTSVPLLIGAGVSASGHYDWQDVPISGAGFFSNYRLYSDVSLVSLEARASLPIALRNAPGWFIMPRIGAGLLIDDYAIDRINFTEYFTGAAFEIRPALQVGYSWGAWSAGGEVSYMAAWGDFGGLGHWAQDFRIGAFVRFKY